MKPNPLCPVPTLTIGTCHESSAWQFSVSCWERARLLRSAGIDGCLCRFLGRGTTGSQRTSRLLSSKDPVIPQRGEKEARIDLYSVFAHSEILDLLCRPALILVLLVQLSAAHACIGRCIAPPRRRGKLEIPDFTQS